MPRITNTDIKKLNQVLFDNNVDLNIFETDTRNEQRWKILYKPTELYFQIIKRDKDYHVTRYYPDKKLIEPINLISFENVITEFSKWTEEVWEDINTDINPINVKTESFSKEITNISPDFIKIYNQGLRAESYGLNEISGFGLRKALEFLVKDYLIKNTEQSEHQFIIEQPVVKCLKKYPEIIDKHILETGERAFWLGNDHSHYYRRHKGMTIENLKELITLTIEWIEIKEKTTHYKKILPN